MESIIASLSQKANKLKAAIAIHDGSDNFAFSNDQHRNIYPFIDFNNKIGYYDVAWACIKHRKFDDESIYEDPSRWINYSSNTRRYMRFSQTLTRHSDGRIVQVTYERLEGTDGWWYQMRRDITVGFLQRVRDGLDPLAPFTWGEQPEAPAQPAFLVRLLDVLPHPAALITTRGHVIDSNRAFSAILARGDGLAVVGGRIGLSAATGEEQQALAKRAAGFNRRRTRTPVSLRVPRLEGQTPYFATLTEPPSGHLGWEAAPGGILLLSVADPDALPALAPRTLADLLQITRSEAQVALALGAGRTVEEIATDRGVEKRTVYNQVASILGKTGFRNQAAIVRQVTALSYVFGPRI